jgi:hypothetical protein
MDPKYDPPKDYSHIAIGIVLLAVAAVLYALGYGYAAGALVAVGVVTEVAAWAFLLDGNRSMPKVEVPAVLAHYEKSEGENK